MRCFSPQLPEGNGRRADTHHLLLTAAGSCLVHWIVLKNTATHMNWSVKGKKPYAGVWGWLCEEHRLLINQLDISSRLLVGITHRPTFCWPCSFSRQEKKRKAYLQGRLDELWEVPSEVTVLVRSWTWSGAQRLFDVTARGWLSETDSKFSGWELIRGESAFW